MQSFPTTRRQNACFRIVSLILAITPLCLILAAVVRASGQQRAATPSPGDWTQFHRDNMQRWNPYETVLGVGNAGGLKLKWRTPSTGAFIERTASHIPDLAGRSERSGLCRLRKRPVGCMH